MPRGLAARSRDSEVRVVPLGVEHAVAFNLADELKKGEHVLAIPGLFPRNTAAEAFAARINGAPGDALLARAILTTFIVVLVTTVAGALVTMIRGGRRVKVGVSLAAVAAIVVVVLTVALLSTQGPTDRSWVEFSIGPATGDAVSINKSGIRGDG